MNTLISLLLVANAAVFIEGTSVNLRAKPSAKAKVVKRVSIGTACEQVSTTGDWVELRCGKARGFTKTSLVSAARPTAKALLQRAASSTRAQDKLKYTLRASLLDDAKVPSSTLRKAWLDAEFEILKASKRAPEAWRAECMENAHVAPDCVEQVFADFFRDWWRIDVRGEDFVLTAGLDEGRALYIVLGRVKYGVLQVRLTGDYRAEATLYKALKTGESPCDMCSVTRLFDDQTLKLVSEIQDGAWRDCAKKSDGAAYAFSRSYDFPHEVRILGESTSEARVRGGALHIGPCIYRPKSKLLKCEGAKMTRIPSLDAACPGI